MNPIPSAPSLHHHSWKGRLRTILIAGLLILTPLYVTAYVLLLLFRFMDGIFAPLIDRTLGAFFEHPEIHIPGLGLVLTLSVVLFLGWLSTSMVGRQMIEMGESLIRRIPIAKSIYSATKGVLEAVSRDQTDAFKKVVLVEYPRRGMFGLGFVTTGGMHFSTADPVVPEELVAVFIPTTPNPTSGFLLLVRPSEILEVDLTVEEGLRMVVSGAILCPDSLRIAARPAEEPVVVETAERTA